MPAKLNFFRKLQEGQRIDHTSAIVLARVRTQTAGQKIRRHQLSLQLPNISGGFNANNGVAHGYDNYFFADGAFSCTGSTDPARPGNAGGSGGGGRIKMSASGSSSLYGRSSTVQPKSVRILPLIKF